MNQEPREILQKLVSERGESVYRDAKLCKALLQDLCGQYPKENFLLVAALERRIVSEIRKCSTSAAPAEIRLAQLSTRLQDLGFKAEEANWAIESWAEALGIEARLPETPPTSIPNPSSGQVTRLQKENEDLSRTVQLLRDELRKLSSQSDSGEVNRLQQEVRQLNDELVKRSGQGNTAKKTNHVLAIGGMIAGITFLAGLVGLYLQSQQITELSEQVSSLESTNRNLSEKFLESSRNLNTLLNIRNNLIHFFGQDLDLNSIELCNQVSGNKTLATAVVYQYESNWRSLGWYLLKPNECKTIQLTNNQQRKIYVFGDYSGRTVTENRFSSRDRYFCINVHDAFNIPNSEQQSLCTGEKNKMVKMSEFFLTKNVTTWNFTDPTPP
jgi:uncharacterized membrane protein